MDHQRYCLQDEIHASTLFNRLTVSLPLLAVLISVSQPLYADDVSPADVPLTDQSVTPPAEYLILDVYDTLKQAQARAVVARRQGGDVRVRAEEVPVTLDNLRLGIYSDSASADAAVERLRRNGIKGQVIGGAGNGYAVSIGVFSDSDNALQTRDRLTALGFDNVRITPLQIVKTRYVVEKRLPPGKSVPKVIGSAADEPDVAQSAPLSKSRHDVTWGIGLDAMRFETGWLTHGSQPVDASHYVHASADAHMLIRHRWELRLAGRFDGYYQTGIPGVHTTHVDYGESYIRYHGNSSRITAGAQTVIWGRTDEIPPNDRMSVQDLSRFILDELPQRRRAVAALRVEEFAGPFKADLLWVPAFRPAELPTFDNIWSPVDRVNGRIISIKSTPILTQLIQQGRFARDAGGKGGAGLRFSGNMDAFDYAITVQRTRHSLPYYRFDPVVRAQLLNGASVASAIAASDRTFTEVHPWSWFIGPDLSFEALSATWRLEAAYVTNVPATTSDYRYTTVKGVDWVAGVEFYPGDSNTRVNIQLAGSEMFNPPLLLDRYNIYSVNGSVESPFLHDRWRARLHFSFGLDKEDVYINPELAYTAWEPNEFYIAAHYFAGAPGTFGGFHQAHDLITLGWQTKY